MHTLSAKVLIPTLILASIIAACGGDEMNSAGGDASTDVPCTDSNFANSVMLASGFTLVDLASYQEGSIALVSDSESGLQLITSASEVIPLVAQEPRLSALSKGPGNTICATWTPDKEGPLQRACSPNFEVQQLTGQIRVSDDLHVAESDALGTVAFFKSGASADAATLEAGGSVWQEVELFESSISSFDDAISHEGIPYACMVTPRSSFESGPGLAIESEIGSSLDRVFTIPETGISNCRLQVKNDTLFVFYRTTVDEGYEFHLGSLQLDANGVQEGSWLSESLGTENPQRTRFFYSDAPAVMYNDYDTSEVVIRTKINTEWEEARLASPTLSSLSGNPLAVYHPSGALDVATTGKVDDNSSLGFYRVCPEL